jgi:hypothetical protein
VVDRADAVIALWDGEPSRGRGGTAEIVAYAKERGVPLVLVSTNSPYAIDAALLHTPRARLVADAAHELGKFNAARIPDARFAMQENVQSGYWGVSANPGDSSDLDRLTRGEIAAQVLPCFVRADLRALRTQWWFLRLSSANFMMAAGAVLVVSVQTTFFRTIPWIVAIEIVLLGLLIVIPLVNRRWWRFHDRWISYRFLAERLRSTYFLTLAGTGDRRERSSKLAYFSDPEDVWIERALEEATIGLPRTPVSVADAVPLREYLSRYWIADQMRYHEKTSRVDGSRETVLLLLTATLFGLTVVAAFLHAFEVNFQLGALSLGAILLVVSVSVPAIGAAVHGVNTQRQFGRHSERYARMARLLRQLREEMDRAETMEEIGRIAADTERIMREENSDWFGVMRFHDMELIT